MTDLFDERERGYEAKWAHDEEAHFRAMSMRNRLLGEWAGGRLSLTGAALADYAAGLVRAGVTGKGHDPVFDRLHADFAEGKVDVSDTVLKGVMKQLYERAKKEVLDGKT
ncbi:MAG TPA: DUF1476 domain-containing protein [Rhizomicrobium sp.]|nr:DUF1476 domain-containing protein [Rhizomicrobium sp.]